MVEVMKIVATSFKRPRACTAALGAPNADPQWIMDHRGSLWMIIMDDCWIIKKSRKYQKNICFCFIDYVKDFDCVDHNKLWKILQESWEYQTT